MPVFSCITRIIAALSIAGGISGASAENLTAADVQQVLSASIQEATARGVSATISVVDRVGNVLAVYDMNSARTNVTVTSKRGIPAGNGLEKVDQTFAGLGFANTPSTRLAAIAKAITGAYLSSGGNAFTTRTASQIVQEHFNPGEKFSPSGPLFGVQFTQMPCSDLSVRFATNGAVPPGFVDTTAGPKRSPLGLSADPGGLPLYKNGHVVGGIGVEADGFYALDLKVSDFDSDVDEIIAFAGQKAGSGFEPPVDIRANRIFVEGKSFRYLDITESALRTNPSSPPALDPASLVTVTGYFTASGPPGVLGDIVAGQTYGDVESGFAADNTGTYDFVGQPVFILYEGTPQARYPPTAAASAGGMTANEVTTIIGNALKIAYSARAQIRRPRSSHAQVTVSIVDVDGNILGIARTPDGPIFGTDTSLQKARTAAFFSSSTAAAYLGTFNSSGANNPADVGGLTPAAQNVNRVVLSSYLTNLQNFVGPSALADGVAFADRSGGNLSRPFFPDGIDGRDKGPLSVNFNTWSPFNTGFQLDALIDNIAQHVLFADGLVASDSPATCSSFNRVGGGGTLTRFANGIQIFPGSVPIYRNGVLIGGIGVSGDGIDQDDMIAFLGLNDASTALNTGIQNAPPNIRADNILVRGTRLRFVNCPVKPFNSSRDRNPCHGK